MAARLDIIEEPRAHYRTAAPRYAILRGLLMPEVVYAPQERPLERRSDGTL